MGIECCNMNSKIIGCCPVVLALVWSLVPTLGVEQKEGCKSLPMSKHLCFHWSLGARVHTNSTKLPLFFAVLSRTPRLIQYYGAVACECEVHPTRHVQATQILINPPRCSGLLCSGGLTT